MHHAPRVCEHACADLQRGPSPSQPRAQHWAGVCVGDTRAARPQSLPTTHGTKDRHRPQRPKCQTGCSGQSHKRLRRKPEVTMLRKWENAKTVMLHYLYA